jgi:enoyl-CoA hydratase/carnithine racemase
MEVSGMHFVKVEIGGGIATIALNRGKVNAINQFSGAMYSAEKAMELGLVQAISN